MQGLKSHFRLRFVVPLVAIAVAGLAVFQLGLIDRFTGTDETASALPTSTEAAPPSEPTSTSPAETTSPEPAEEEASKPKPTGMEQLNAELSKHKVVVVVAYSPDGAVDSLAISEARLGADDAKAGFLALNGAKERQIGELAEEYDVRDTPTVLIFERGPSLANKVVGWADRPTVAQLVEDARRTP